MRIKAKIRYSQSEQWATVTQIDTDMVEVVFDEPQRAITKGQAVVFYDGDIVVGGGTIQQASHKTILLTDAKIMPLNFFAFLQC